MYSNQIIQCNSKKKLIMAFEFFFYKTALHNAVIKQNIQIIRLLINQKGIDINLKDKILH